MPFYLSTRKPKSQSVSTGKVVYNKGMKKNIKHKFRHQDPEKVITSKKSTPMKEIKVSKNLSYETADLKKTGILISIFVLSIILLYFVQIKTDLLRPVLKLFGL